MKAFLAHMRVLWGLRRPSVFAARESARQTRHTVEGVKHGTHAGRNAILSEIARMPRNERRKIVSGAVKVFGRKPRRTVDGFRPGVIEEEQDALAYLRGVERSMGWPEWKEGQADG